MVLLEPGTSGPPAPSLVVLALRPEPESVTVQRLLMVERPALDRPQNPEHAL